MKVPGYPAVFDEERVYRYALWRKINDKRNNPKIVAFIGLNPSTADETKDDATIRRCKGYARDWGYDALVMLNLFAFRATQPKVMMAALDPVGKDNDAWLVKLAGHAAMVVAAWGPMGKCQGRDKQVVDLFVKEGIPLHRLIETADGSPGHPLRLPKVLTPQPWIMPIKKRVRRKRGS